jgi:hypothetical protein
METIHIAINEDIAELKAEQHAFMEVNTETL